MNRTGSQTRRRSVGAASGGWSLLHLLNVLVLLSVFMLLSGKLFQAILYATRDAKTRQSEIWQLESVVSMLRRDVWGATQVQSPSDRQLELVRPDGSRITWRGHDGLARSESGGRTLAWPQLTHDWRFAVDGGAVQLHVPDVWGANEPRVTLWNADPRP